MKRLLIALLLGSTALGQQAVQLTWTASTTAGTSVQVYRAPTCQGPFIVVGSGVAAGGPFNTVIPNTPGTSVAFQVTAILPGAPESAPSNCATVTIPLNPPPSPPAAPTGLTVTPQR